MLQRRKGGIEDIFTTALLSRGLLQGRLAGKGHAARLLKEREVVDVPPFSLWRLCKNPFLFYTKCDYSL